jgi:hypothetical protein
MIYSYVPRKDQAVRKLKKKNERKKKLMNVDFTGVEEAVAKFESYLTPGVYEMTITGVEFGRI